MPLYDVYCDQCLEEIEDVLMEVNEDGFICPDCGSEMKRKCNCSHFKLVYNNKKDICGWGNDSYETSQYGRKVKAAREQGENVKSPDDKY